MTEIKRTEVVKVQNCFSKTPTKHRRSGKVAEVIFGQRKGSEEKTNFAGKDLEKKTLSKTLTSFCQNVS